MTPQDASNATLTLCQIAPVIPVLVVDDANQAPDLAAALVAGGLPVLEITLRTPAALDAIAAMAPVAGAHVGAGTVLTPDDAQVAKSAGAGFAVSPGATDALMQACEDLDLPLLPGAATATESMALLERGYRMQKFFPAQVAGGPSALRALGGPLPQVQFCPTGGLSADNARDYLDLGNVICVGGSWVAPKDLVAKGDWSAIQALARTAQGLAT